MKKSSAVILASVLASALLVSCGNPWIKDLTDPLAKEKEKDNPQTELPFPDIPNTPETPNIPETTLNLNPQASDFEIGNLEQAAGNVTPVTITPKAGKSNGAITVYYDGSINLPSSVGLYTVTFDVAESEGWNAAYGLTAGTLTINPPVISSVNDLSTWLTAQPANTASTPYTVVLDGISNSNISTIKSTLTGSGKYVNLDLSRNTSITSIPDNTFSNCTILTGITLPDSVTVIGSSNGAGAFKDCTSLKSVTIPDSVTSVGDSSFADCTSLTSVIIGSKVESIGHYSFLNCNALVSVTFSRDCDNVNPPFPPSVSGPRPIEPNKTYIWENVAGTFPDQTDLIAKYGAGGAGTYVRSGSTWTKQP